jgi:hypothetical protein
MKKFGELFSLDFFASLMGILELNSVTTMSCSAEGDEVLETEGIGLFSIISLMNHSCSPNAALIKLKDCLDDSFAVVAVKEIRLGDEVCISYIDEHEDFNKRKSELREYGFSCACSKCSE